MKLFLKKILFFFSPLFVVTIMVDLYLANINSLYKEKVCGMLEYANKIEILILGNSCAAYGVDPMGFSSFAFIRVFAVVFETLKLYTQKLKAIFIPFIFFFLS